MKEQHHKRKEACLNAFIPLACHVIFRGIGQTSRGVLLNLSIGFGSAFSVSRSHCTTEKHPSDAARCLQHSYGFNITVLQEMFASCSVQNIYE